jgi:hypothetical protein
MNEVIPMHSILVFCMYETRGVILWSSDVVSLAQLIYSAFQNNIIIPCMDDHCPLFSRTIIQPRPVLIRHQPTVLFSQNKPATSDQPEPASSTLLLEQTSTSHQPPANRTGCLFGGGRWINRAASLSLRVRALVTSKILYADVHIQLSPNRTRRNLSSYLNAWTCIYSGEFLRCSRSC